MPPQHNVVLSEDTDDDDRELLEVVRKSHLNSQYSSFENYWTETTACVDIELNGEDMAPNVPDHGAGESVVTGSLMNTDHGQEGLSKLDRFREMLHNAVPLAFLPTPLVKFIRKESVLRLRKAKEDEVPLNELIVGQDCLLTWPDFGWDSEEETLHMAIQNRLIDLEAAQKMGDLVRERFIAVANARIQTACKAGLTIQAVSIGPDLLPIWDATSKSDHHHNAARAFMPEDHEPQSTQMSMESLATPSSATNLFPVNDIVGITSFNNDMAVDLMSFCDSDSDGGAPVREAADTSDSTEDEATYEEYDGDLTNVVAGVDVVGGSERCSSVDLEVYLAEDDDDEFEALPEVELALDGDAFISHFAHFGERGMVEVELPNASTFCFDGIEDTDGVGKAKVQSQNDMENKSSMAEGISRSPERELSDAPPASVPEERDCILTP